MDKEQKKAAIAAADQAVVDAQSALTAAKASLETAKTDGDDSGIVEAQGKVETATAALTEAQSKRTALGEADVDADDIVDDALGAKKPLADGTDPKKPVSIPFDKFQELNEQAKLFQQFSPVLAQLQKDPKLLEKVMKGDDPNKSFEERIKAIEEKAQVEKRTEVTTVINAAVATWPDFRKHWDSMKPLLVGLEAQGLPYADAVQRAYYAVNPDAVAEGKKIVEQYQARAAENRRGQMGGFSGSGGSPIHAGDDDGYVLNDADRAFAQATGVDPKLYAKHADYLKKFADL